MSTEKKVGIVFILGLVLAGFFTIMIGRGELNIFKKGYTINVIFDSVGGLAKGDPVELAGMKIGKVESMTVREGRIDITLRIDSGVRLQKDSAVTIMDVSPLGGKKVCFTMGSHGGEYAPPGKVFVGTEPTGTTELVDNLSEVSARLKRGEGTAGKLIMTDDLYKDMKEISVSLKSISARIASGEGTLGRLVMEDELHKDLKEVSADVKKLVSALNKVVDENKDDIRVVVAEMKKAAPKLNEALETIKNISKKIERGEGTAGKIISDEKLYDEVKETIKTAGDTSKKISDFADRINRLKTYVGVESMYNENSDRTLSKVYLRLEPGEDKFYQIGASALTGEGTSFETEDEGDIEGDIQIGRRLFDRKLTLRAGLLESRVGGGMDYVFPWDRFSLTVEGRDVYTKEQDESIDPFLLRAWLRYRIYRGIYLNAGVDNILDKPGVYSGLKLEYSDEDIKALVSVLGIGF